MKRLTLSAPKADYHRVLQMIRIDERGDGSTQEMKSFVSDHIDDRANTIRDNKLNAKPNELIRLEEKVKKHIPKEFHDNLFAELEEQYFDFINIHPFHKAIYRYKRHLKSILKNPPWPLKREVEFSYIWKVFITAIDTTPPYADIDNSDLVSFNAFVEKPDEILLLEEELKKQIHPSWCEEIFLQLEGIYNNLLTSYPSHEAVHRYKHHLINFQKKLRVLH